MLKNVPSSFYNSDSFNDNTHVRHLYLLCSLVFTLMCFASAFMRNLGMSNYAIFAVVSHARCFCVLCIVLEVNVEPI